MFITVKSRAHSHEVSHSREISLHWSTGVFLTFWEFSWPEIGVNFGYQRVATIAPVNRRGLDRTGI